MAEKTTGSGSGSTSSTTDLHAGLSDRSPKFPDKSMQLKGGSVDDDATRSSVAPTPGTLGPRSA